MSMCEWKRHIHLGGIFFSITRSVNHLWHFEHRTSGSRGPRTGVQPGGSQTQSSGQGLPRWSSKMRKAWRSTSPRMGLSGGSFGGKKIQPGTCVREGRHHPVRRADIEARGRGCRGVGVGRGTRLWCAEAREEPAGAVAAKDEQEGEEPENTPQPHSVKTVQCSRMGRVVPLAPVGTQTDACSSASTGAGVQMPAISTAGPVCGGQAATPANKYG